MHENKPLSTKNVAELLGVSERYVLYLVKEGKLKSTRLGERSWAFSRADVEAYQQGKTTDSGTVG